MTTLEHTRHATRRKGYAPHYTPANLALLQPEIRDFTIELLNVRHPPLLSTSVVLY